MQVKIIGVPRKFTLKRDNQQVVNVPVELRIQNNMYCGFYGTCVIEAGSGFGGGVFLYFPSKTTGENIPQPRNYQLRQTS